MKEKPKAKLIPVQMEVPNTKGGGYRWVTGYQVINPYGQELQPHLRPKDAIKLCRENGWAFEEGTR